jgi:hypothetical protein
MSDKRLMAHDKLLAAAQAVVNDGLDTAEEHVHVCDKDNDEVKAKSMPASLQALYYAVQAVRKLSAFPGGLAQPAPIAEISWSTVDGKWALNMLCEPVSPPDHPVPLYAGPTPGLEPRDLTADELADPEYMQGYIESCNESLACVLAENQRLKAVLALRTEALDSIELHPLSSGAACERDPAGRYPVDPARKLQLAQSQQHVCGRAGTYWGICPPCLATTQLANEPQNNG